MSHSTAPSPPSCGSDVEAVLARLSRQPGVEGVLVCTPDGLPLRSTLTPGLTALYAGGLVALAARATAAVRDTDPTDSLCFLRLRTARHEVMIAPDKNYILIVLQVVASS